jgi:hypothetical protein
MKGIKFTEQTGRVAICLFTIYLLYGILYIPVTEYLTCIAIGGITYGVTLSYEVSLLAILVSSFLFQLRKRENFVGAPLVMEEPKIPEKKYEVEGVSSSFSEGFEDSNTETGVIDVAKVADPTVPVTVSVPSSTIASSVPAVPTISDQGVPPVTQPAESFEDSGGLFKLGQIPKDDKGGFHIDSGTSILNALKSLKPDQIQAMTQDTKQLIDTQKSLMNMLQSFKPMMSEGKEMMATFQEMFSPTSTAPGSVGGALQTVGKM